jgi:hypothetical protein
MPYLTARYAPRLPGIFILPRYPGPSHAERRMHALQATPLVPPLGRQPHCAALSAPSGPVRGTLARCPAYVAASPLAPFTVAVRADPATLAPCTLPVQRAPKFGPYSRPTSRRDR